MTDGRIRWGLLTNGEVWRLYDYRARPRASGYLEVDLYFHLYGLGREDAGCVLGTFPIVRRHDEAQFGSYRTRDLS